MRTRFQPDRQLTTRMVVTMLLLGLVYVAFIAVLIALLDSLFAVVVIAAALLFAQYFFSDRIALLAMGAQEVSPQEAPRLHAIVDRLCATADMPKPRGASAQSERPNAFATGGNQKRACICPTPGATDRYDHGAMAVGLEHA